MPAARSNAETEIREAVVARLRHFRPGSRIIHEINIFERRNRVDVMAVDRTEIITVEIKSEKDKLDRLTDQLAAMRRCSHISIAALHRRFMPEVTDLSTPRLDGVPHDVETWWYPSAADMAEAHHPAFNWTEPDLRRSLGRCLPEMALSMLWRAELLQLCADAGVSTDRSADMECLKRAIRWQATGSDITKGICRALRRRDPCAEADPPIQDA